MKQFLCILFLAVLTGCSDNQATVEEESKTTVNREKSADDKSNTTERGINDVDVDTIGMAEFLALKAAVAANAKQATDENDINADTTGFTAYKRSKAKTAKRPCDCPDSVKAERDSKTNEEETVDTTELQH